MRCLFPQDFIQELSDPKNRDKVTQHADFANFSSIISQRTQTFTVKLTSPCVARAMTFASAARPARSDNYGTRDHGASRDVLVSKILETLQLLLSAMASG